jgi:hypothetical protein
VIPSASIPTGYRLWSAAGRPWRARTGADDPGRKWRVGLSRGTPYRSYDGNVILEGLIRPNDDQCRVGGCASRHPDDDGDWRDSARLVRGDEMLRSRLWPGRFTEITIQFLAFAM